MNYKISDIKLAAQGEKNITWAESQMGALLAVRQRFAKEKPLKGYMVGMALHVTKETAALVETLRSGGAIVAICGCNPLSSQDDVCAALAKRGVAVFAWKGQTTKDYYASLEAVITQMRQGLAQGLKLATIDDGCDLVTMIHQKYPDLLPHLTIATEETTTGVIRLRAMEQDGALKVPAIAVNDNQTKHLFDNYYGTGQSTLDGILRATSVLLAGKRFVIAGYGHCGRGVAERARGMGSLVIVTEIDPVKALQARMDGFMVMPMSSAAMIGDIFVTTTGNKHVITLNHIKKMKDGAILANSGHFDIEIDTDALRKSAAKVEQTRPGLEKFTVGKRSVYLCGEGRLVNLACAEGHPSVVMSLSFCGQALAVEYGVKHQGDLKPGVKVPPAEIDQNIANLQLEAMGISKDKLTAAQKHYLSSWEEGT